jgi:hypothetical protein
MLPIEALDLNVPSRRILVLGTSYPERLAQTMPAPLRRMTELTVIRVRTMASMWVLICEIEYTELIQQQNPLWIYYQCVKWVF